jgi:hypothetical protein
MQTIEAFAIDNIQNEGNATNETSFFGAFRKIAENEY